MITPKILKLVKFGVLIFLLRNMTVFDLQFNERMKMESDFLIAKNENPKIV
jgi:hypothetical protein